MMLFAAGHHGPDDLFRLHVRDVGIADAPASAVRRVDPAPLEVGEVRGRVGVSFEDHRLAGRARTAVEAVHRNALARRLDDEVVRAVHVVLVRLGDLHLRAVARDIDDLLDRQAVALENDRLVGLGRVDRNDPSCCALATPTFTIDAATSSSPTSKQKRSPFERRIAPSSLLLTALLEAPRTCLPGTRGVRIAACGAGSDQRTACPACTTTGAL